MAKAAYHSCQSTHRFYLTSHTISNLNSNSNSNLTISFNHSRQSLPLSLWGRTGFANCVIRSIRGDRRRSGSAIKDRRRKQSFASPFFSHHPYCLREGLGVKTGPTAAENDSKAAIGETHQHLQSIPASIPNIPFSRLFHCAVLGSKGRCRQCWPDQLLQDKWCRSEFGRGSLRPIPANQSHLLPEGKCLRRASDPGMRFFRPMSARQCLRSNHL